MEKFEDNYFLSDETSRLRNLEKYIIHHNRAEPIFDQLAAMTAKILDMPVALINFVDEDKVWNNSFNGLSSSFGMDVALSAMAVNHENLNLINQLAGKPDLMINPIMAAESGLKFYATVPITTAGGLDVGMICIADQNPRVFLSEEKAKLASMASLVQQEMNRRIADRFCA
jgi:hypothetical protein